MKEKTLILLIGLLVGTLLAGNLTAYSGAAWTRDDTVRLFRLLERIADKR